MNAPHTFIVTKNDEPYSKPAFRELKYKASGILFCCAWVISSFINATTTTLKKILNARFHWGFYRSIRKDNTHKSEYQRYPFFVCDPHNTTNYYIYLSLLCL